ncbi:BrnT family toxin [Brevundimonas sp.]|jgi:hypothetical protein|uniref:BrnT family toxin n=1 Tax=Brevundimonas sp. TaxID=1871086 RepID=UPI002E11AFC6|nr:BrnT family toxin [Brevundimonas sp.]
MAIVFDAAKDARNREKHGLALDLAAEMELDEALIVPDLRHDYGEPRFNAYGLIFGKLHALSFTLRGDDVRVISLRRAREKEVRRHAERTADEP